MQHEVSLLDELDDLILADENAKQSVKNKIILDRKNKLLAEVESRENEIPYQYRNDEFRFCLTMFSKDGSKRPLGKDLDEYGRGWNNPNNLLTYTEIHEWTKRGYGIGFMAGYGNCLIDVDEHETKEQTLALFNNFLPSFTVHTASDKYHIIYFCNEQFEISYPRFKGYKEVNGRQIPIKEMIVQVFGKKGSRQILSPINNSFERKSYRILHDRPIAKIKKDDVLRLLSIYEGLDQDPNKANNKPIEVFTTDSHSDLVNDIESKLTFIEFYRKQTGENIRNGQKPNTLRCPVCNNHSSRGTRFDNACIVYDNHIQCCRCDKKWNKWSFLQDWYNITEKKERVRILSEAARIDINDEKYQVKRKSDNDLPQEFIDETLRENKKQKEDEKEETKKKTKEIESEWEFSLRWNGVTYRQRTDIDERVYWVYPIIPAYGHFTYGIGQKGSGKTWLGLGIADAATKKTFFGRWRCNGDMVVERHPRIAYLDGEMNRIDLSARMHELETNEYFFPYPFKDVGNTDKRATLGIKSYREHVLKRLIEEEIDIVFLDNVFSLFVGVNVIDIHEWSEINDWLTNFREHMISIFVWDHPGKDVTRGAVGSLSKIYNADDTLMVTKHKGHHSRTSIKSDLKFDDFRSGGSLQDGEYVLSDFTIIKHKDKSFEFEYPEQMEYGNITSREEDLRYKALGKLIQEPDFGKLEMNTFLGKGKNCKIIKELVEQRYIKILSDEGTRHEKREVTEFGKSWYRNQELIRGENEGCNRDVEGDAE